MHRAAGIFVGSLLKTGDLTIIYGAVAVLSVLLFAAYFLWEKKRERNFLFLLGCVSAANVGYFLLAAAGSLAFAKAANVVSYFGSAYAVLAMMLYIELFRCCDRLDELTAIA